MSLLHRFAPLIRADAANEESRLRWCSRQLLMQTGSGQRAVWDDGHSPQIG